MADLFWQAPLSEWDGKRVREFLDESVREGDHLEYKGALSHPSRGKWQVTDDLLETIAAMANASDGLIFVGVEADDAGYPVKITGLPHPNPQKAVRDRCASDIEPGVHIDTTIATLPDGDEFAGEQVMLVRVGRGANSPYVLRDKGVYVRNDEHDRPARRADLDALYSRRVTERGETLSPWSQVLNSVTYAGQRFLETPWPVMLVGLTPAFPSSTAVLGHEQDWLFRVICQELIGYDAEPILEPVAVSMQPDENWGDDLQESSARAFSDGTIEGKRFFTGANIGADNIRDVDLVGIWYRFRQMLTAGTRWPREVGGSTGSLLFALGLGNIAGGRLVLPDETGKRHLTAAEWRTPAHLNRIPMWTSRGEWDPTVEVDDLLEREFASLARVLQCIWYDRLRSQVREWSQR